MTAPRPARARRGRTLIVGDVPELARLVPHLRRASQSHATILTQRVNSVFDALGEITAATAASPIVTLVLSDQFAGGDPSHAIEAIRKLDPSVRLVMAVHAPSDDTGIDWTSRGVDECITAPLKPADVLRIFGEDAFEESVSIEDIAELMAAPASNSRPVQSEPPGIGVSTVKEASAYAGPTIHEIPDDEQDDVMTVPSVPTFSTSASASTPPSPAHAADDVHVPERSAEPPHESHTAAEILGDIDLVEAILYGSTCLRDLALRLIVQQTQWSDIALIEPHEHDQSDARDHKTTSKIENPKSIAPVVFDQHTFGDLASSHATVEQLQSWADWLARWLALDRAHRKHRQQCMQDDLTGAGNRRCFDGFLQDAIARAAKARRPVTVMVFDIDDFKIYNDRFGHEAGDDILRETVRLLQAVIRKGDRVCRIGGDEFAVIFADDEAPREPGSRHPESVEAMAKRFQDQICKMRFPKLGSDAPGTLTISAGLATYPWDGADAASLLRHADQLALESKRRGKNLITFGPGAREACGRED